jgi:8-oxo-dGTP diphosphatase
MTSAIPPFLPSTSHSGPVAAAIGVVFKNHHVLLVQRKNPPDAGRWGLPGGKIERGERIAAAVTRELYEETSLTTQAVRVFDAIDVLDPDTPADHHFVLIAVLCIWIEGEPSPGDDALDARWWHLDKLDEPELVLSFGVVEVVREAHQLFMSL